MYMYQPTTLDMIYFIEIDNMYRAVYTYNQYSQWVLGLQSSK